MTQKTIRSWAILGSWLIYIADILIAISDGFGPGFWQGLPDLPTWKVDFAGYALLLFPLLGIGVYILSLGLRQKWLGILGAWFLMTICVFLHTSYFYFAGTARLHAQHPSTSTAKLLESFSMVKNNFMLAYFVLMAILFLFIIVLVLSKKTAFPRWFALSTPLTGILLGRLLNLVAPSIRELLQPFLIPAFWFALMLTIAMIFALKDKNFLEENRTS
ncbi:hypothetical protein C4K46_10415 [Streptococcus oricebi]|uniref:DUF998 domain-containing protein n=2 Tax=Streptococcus oricebi TaxID=1547447 RepID=A0ABS5B686_9STRE|nr:hypothetical protein [Streptococcus oricebi]